MAVIDPIGKSLQSNERIVEYRIGLLNLAEELSNVSMACKIMGLSRDAFYRYKAAVDDGGIDALIDKNRPQAPISKTALKRRQKRL